MTRLGIFCAAAALAVFPAAAQATVIVPTGVTASSQFNASYAASNTINGSGISAPGAIADLHAAYDAGNHWTTAASTNPLDAWIQWSFSAPTTIGTAYIWNHQSTTPHAANGGYEPTVFDLSFYDASNTLILTLSNLSLLPDDAKAQQINFGLVSNVSYVRFDVQATQSSTSYTGLAEVAFDTQSFVVAVPEPSTWATMIGGFGLMGGMMRRRARRVLATA